MTENNMKKLYDWFIESNQPARAAEITAIPRYSKFAESKAEEKPKKEVK